MLPVVGAGRVVVGCAIEMRYDFWAIVDKGGARLAGCSRNRTGGKGCLSAYKIIKTCILTDTYPTQTLSRAISSSFRTLIQTMCEGVELCVSESLPIEDKSLHKSFEALSNLALRSSAALTTSQTARIRMMSFLVRAELKMYGKEFSLTYSA